VDRTGSVSLTAFWARRARRILPAALFVLAVTAVATALIVPATLKAQYFADLRASALYTQNWHLANTAVDYLASANAPSAVQHYWSLAVEEQFYLVWPVAIALTMWAAKRFAPRRTRAATTAILCGVTASSFALSVVMTRANPARAFFVSPTRAWEFGAGGLLAVSGLAEGRPRRALCWLGFGAIALAAVFFDKHTAFPGFAAALPVLGTVAVIAARTPKGRFSPSPAFSLAPVRVVGDLSYAIYLWHWPLLVILPLVTGHGLTFLEKALIIAASVGAARLTKVAIEDPIRFGPVLRSRPGRVTLLATAAGMALVLATITVGEGALGRQETRWRATAVSVLSSHPKCFGALAHDVLHPCANAQLARAVVPVPVLAEREGNADCELVRRTGLVDPCRFGSPARAAGLHFVILGDSHAAHWRAAFAPVAEAHGWSGTSVSRSGCEFTTAVKAIQEPMRSHCVTWNADVYRWFARHPEVTVVFVAQISGSHVETAKGQAQLDAQERGYTAAWAKLPSTVRQIVVMRDTPKMHTTTRVCVQRAIEDHVAASPRCDVRRTFALRADAAATAAAKPRAQRISGLDMNEYLCSDLVCPPVIGGALVYKDNHHLTAVFARTLAPLLERKLASLDVGLV
jgi:peptidoglycan/LPS O-acetylase OafA/YrhL